MSVLRGTDGQVRSGWVLLAFIVSATLVYFAVLVAVTLLRFFPEGQLRLDDWRLLGSSLAVLLSAIAASLLCKLVFGAEIGLGGPVRRGLWIGTVAGIAAISVACLGGLGAELGTLRWGGEALGVTALAGLQQLITIGPTSVGEELLVRGVVLRQLARGTRPWIAVLLTGTAFGVMHLQNPSVTLVAAINIALVGIWFGALVWRTGTLWSSIAVHVVWNWFEGFVFGTPVSGLQPGTSIWVVALSYPSEDQFWFGGGFGPEASGVTTLVLLVANAATLLWPRREFSGNPPNP